MKKIFKKIKLNITKNNNSDNFPSALRDSRKKLKLIRYYHLIPDYFKS